MLGGFCLVGAIAPLGGRLDGEEIQNGRRTATSLTRCGIRAGGERPSGFESKHEWIFLAKTAWGTGELFSVV
jgi:hypothetical protein